MSSHGWDGELINQAPAVRPKNLSFRRFAARCADLPIGFELQLPDGSVHRLGNGNSAFQLVLHNQQALTALASLDQNRVAEAYFAGAFEIEGDMLSALSLRTVLADRNPALALWRIVQPMLVGQTRLNTRVISSHYDRDPAFFLQFLDAEMPIYTQGMYASDEEPFSAAALRKLEYCYEKCRLKPGDHILEIGPGWGPWLKYASDRGVKCTGISLSQYSIDYLAGVAREGGYDWELIFSDLLTFQTDQKYDAIVMMGIIEHLPQYGRVLRKFMSCLKPGGYIFLDGASQKRRSDLSSVIIKHIFPGNHMLLVLHDFLKELARTPFEVEEIFDDRHSYFMTFRQWALNLERNQKAVVDKFGAWNYRLFRLYLWGFSYNMKIGDAGCYRMILHYPKGPSAH